MNTDREKELRIGLQLIFFPSPIPNFLNPDVQILLDKAVAFIQALTEQTAKAYGNCVKCYGKGFSTVRRGETYRGSTHNMRTGMKFCTCERGKQLEELTEQAVLEGRKQTASDILNLANEYANQDKTMRGSEQIRNYHYFNAIHKIGEFDGR